jgi:hypothetical protein
LIRRRHAAGSIVQVYNLGEAEAVIARDALWPLETTVQEHISGAAMTLGNRIQIPARASWWLTNSS